MESTEVKKENKMGTMPVVKLIVTMSLPAILSMTVLAMYNVVDSIFVGNYSQNGLAALSIVYPMQLLLISVSVGTAVGVNSLVSRKLGEKEFAEANSAATHGLITCLFSYVLFLLLGIFAVEPFMNLFTKDPEIMQFGIDYLRIVLILSIFSIIQVMIEKTLQATGNMIYPMLFQMLGAVVNIIFDPLLIFGIGPFPEMGINGAAIATVFGQFCGMLFAVIVLFTKTHQIKITFRGFKIKANMFRQIYAVGFPSVIMQSISAIMMLGLNTIFTMNDSAVSVTVLGVYFKLQSFVFMPCFGLNQGVLPVLGYNYGARNKKRVYSTLKCGIIIAVCIMAVGVTLMWLIPDKLIAMFGGDQSLMEAGVPAFRIISLCFIPAAVSIILITLFQATGKGFRGLFISFARQLVVLLPVAYLLSVTLGVGYVWYAFPIAEAVALVIALLFFLNLVRGDFKKLQ